MVRGDGVRRYGQGSVRAYGLGATRLSPRASSCTGSQSFLNEEPAPPSIAYCLVGERGPQSLRGRARQSAC